MERIEGVVDLHCHILPGVDDGAVDLAASVAMLRCAAAEGIAHMVATPHTCDGRYEVSRDRAHAAFQELRRAAHAAGIGVELSLAGEVHLDPRIPDLLRRDPGITLDGRGRYLLLELPHETVPPSLPQFLFTLRTLHTTPVIAHPERNLAVRQSPELVVEWLRLGVLCQLTAGSFTGVFGTSIRACAERFLSRGQAHVIATDSHSAQRRAPRVQDAALAVAALVGEDGARALFVDNPRRLLRGEPREALTVPEPRRRRPLFGWLSRR
jgi:protein-tyrosine phosphatase